MRRAHSALGYYQSLLRLADAALAGTRGGRIAPSLCVVGVALRRRGLLRNSADQMLFRNSAMIGMTRSERWNTSR
jgi:hypothetical protein